MSTASRPKTVAELFGVPPPATTGRERIISAGIELFYRHGILAVSLDQVIEFAGVTKTTFYKHFEGKDDLVLACIRYRDAWETQAWERAIRLMGGDDPRSQLVACFDVLDVWFNDPDFRGCMFVNSAIEVPDKRDPIHIAAAAHVKRNRDNFRDLAVRAGAKDPEGFADQYMILVDGTLMLRHVLGRDDAAKVAKPAAIDLVNRHIPA